MAGSDLSLSEVIDMAVRAGVARVHTSIPAQVVSYDPVRNVVAARAAVQDFVIDDDGERVWREMPVLPSVPVMWPRGGGMIARTPLQPGDHVWLVFAERSLAEWRSSGQVSEPTDARRHSVGYPYAIPGAEPDTSPPSPVDAPEVAAGGMIVGADGGPSQMIVDGILPGFRFGKLAVMPIALAPPLAAAATASAAAATADAATSAPQGAALDAIVAALAAITAIPANSGAAAAVAAAGAAVGTAKASQAASAAAAGAASAAMTAAATGCVSTMVKSI